VTSEFRAVLESRAIGLVIDARLSQLARGHSADADAALPVHALPAKAKEFAQIAGECCQPWNGETNLPRARKKLAETAALCLAAIDRIDREIGADA
jgi:hypothetical protein